MTYLDSGATTLVKPAAVAEAVSRAIRTCASPGRGGHAAAMRGAETVFNCRNLACELFSVPTPEQVVLTFNATHALNIAIKCCVRPGDRVIVSGYEHNSVTRPLHALGAHVEPVRSAPFDSEKCFEGFRKAIARGADAVVCTHVSNVFGGIMPVEKLGKLCGERGIPFIVDASQSAGSLDVNFESLGADFVAMPGHKGLYGPQGTGLLLCRRSGEPVMSGGTGSLSRIQSMPEFLPDRLEAGTHNVPGAAGLAEGIKFVLERTPAKILAHERELLAQAKRELDGIPGIKSFYGGEEQGGVMPFIAAGEDVEDTAAFLGEKGIAVRAGLHCSPLAHETAGTLGTGTVRMSLSAFNTGADIRRLAGALRKKREK